MSIPQDSSLARLESVCFDLGWDPNIVIETVILALSDKRFRVLAPSKEEWATMRTKLDSTDLLNNRFREITGRSWSHDDVMAFKNQIELEFIHPVRKEVSFETQLQLLFNKDQKCVICGVMGPDMIPEIDHKIPAKRGGSSQYYNLQWLCRSCNRRKQAKIGMEWKNA